MPLKIYNTLTRKKEIFEPREDKKINMFVCGPTVYDYSHLGHAKTYIQFDVIARYLRFIGYKVFYLQNITDIDDKIIKRAKEEGDEDGWKRIKEKYEISYMEDMKKLNVNSVNKYAKATDYIPEIISQVKRLIKKGYAYKISDGWYFDLSKDRDYGKLAKRTETELNDAVSRVDENKEKRNKGDFCLWKFSKPGEPVWKSDLGDGRPGWHIEDTAITEKEFGVQYDIHGGGIDLIFPHHEAEIAQMESISGKKPLVRYWMHTGFLEINSEKMGKSKKNFYTIDEILERGYNPLALRYFFLSAHYKKPLNFTWENLNSSQNAYERLKNIISELKKSRQKINKKNIDGAKKQFLEIINDDFNMPKALSFLWEILRDERLNDSEKYELALDFDKVLGLKLGEEEKVSVPHEVQRLVEEREKARGEKNFKKADEIREKIRKSGYVIEDTESGARVRKV
ncbi:MAG: cysteine--tRNA ligase [Candidatus Nanoarchaeia archaeon]|nr:cysteine--tRNA ligase [Candidatus Nanoarchaeia archaeon]